MKNQWMSMWLSAANKAAGAARGASIAQLRRQQTALTKAMLGAAGLAAPKSRRAAAKGRKKL